MPDDLLKLRGDVWEGYAFIHDLDDEFFSPLIFTRDTIIGEGFVDNEVMIASSDLYKTNAEDQFQWIPVGTIRKWERRQDGLWATGSLYRERDKHHMALMRPLLQEATRRKFLGLTYSGDKNLIKYKQGSRRILERFPVLFLSFYFRRVTANDTQESTGSTQAVRTGDEAGEDVHSSAVDD